MGGWNGQNGHSSGSDEHEPSEERGQAAWGAQGQGGSSPPWASAETQTSHTPPPWVPDRMRTDSTPFPVPPAPPVPPSPGPRRFLVILTAMAVLGAGVGAGVWFVTREGVTGAGGTPGPGVVVTTAPPKTSGTPGTTPPETPPESTTPPPSPVDSPPPSPATGYRVIEDPVGYTLFVPEDWTRRQEQGVKAPVVFYDDPADGRQLHIFLVTEDDDRDSLFQAENSPDFGLVHLNGYQALERDEGATWSELTYRYDDEDKGPRQVIDHRFKAAEDTYYAIRASGPEDMSLAQIREPLTQALSSFCLRDQLCL
ncbi:hypothetical protein [Streptomyces sp. NPDC046909]|uniref:hypothetical protein n=1 Tax=Streptomyces sp. NPDC046909 TaxID=3155617 RepID=UPI0033DFCD5F